MAVAALRRLCFLSLLLLTSPTVGDVVEELVVARGPGRFGEQPHIVGSTVVWQRYADEPQDDVIQLREIENLGTPIVGTVHYRADWGGVVANQAFIFMGRLNGVSPDGVPVVAVPVARISQKPTKSLVVSPFGIAVTANHDFVFIKTSEFEPAPNKSSIFARRLADLGRPDAESMRVITRLKSDSELSRSEAASDAYFVWQDRDSEPGSTWKLYARPVAELFEAGSERLVADIGLTGLGFYIGLDGSLLVSQAQTWDETTANTLYLFDLDEGGPPRVIYQSETRGVTPQWPDLSEEYVVWTVVDHFFGRTPFAQRLEEGIPVGEPFAIGTGGSWITIDRNIAVYNGSTSFDGGDVVHSAIVAVELDLPGAEDVGDADGNGRVNLTDAVGILNYLFAGGWQPRLRLADADLDGTITIADAIRILEYLFQAGSRPGS